VHLIVWEFDVKPGAEGRFETMYGPDGEWVSLFRGDTGWLGSELLRDVENPHRYCTIDRWRSAHAYDRFQAAMKVRYERIDRLGEGLTVTERLIGRFEVDAWSKERLHDG
jgi:heme-degrading monooxygenase HmoA